eukprot:3935331-Pleurochrysis_carterae.AAC.1
MAVAFCGAAISDSGLTSLATRLCFADGQAAPHTCAVEHARAKDANTRRYAHTRPHAPTRKSWYLSELGHV